MLDAVLDGEDEKYNVNTSIGIIFFIKLISASENWIEPCTCRSTILMSSIEPKKIVSITT